LAGGEGKPENLGGETVENNEEVKIDIVELVDSGGKSK